MTETHEYPVGWESITAKPAMQSDWWKSPLRNAINDAWKNYITACDLLEINSGDISSRLSLISARLVVEMLMAEEFDLQCKKCDCYAKDDDGKCRNCGS